MPTDLMHPLAEEECSNETLGQKLATALRTQKKKFKKKLAKALRTQTQKQDTELIELKKQVRDLTDRLRSKCAQIADNDEELFELRTENESLKAQLYRARCSCQGGSGVRRCRKPGHPHYKSDSD